MKLDFDKLSEKIYNDTRRSSTKKKYLIKAYARAMESIAQQSASRKYEIEYPNVEQIIAWMKTHTVLKEVEGGE